MPIDKVRKVMKIAKEPVSLETPIGDEDDTNLGDFIQDINAIIPLDAAINTNLRGSYNKNIIFSYCQRGKSIENEIWYRNE